MMLRMERSRDEAASLDVAEENQEIKPRKQFLYLPGSMTKRLGKLLLWYGCHKAREWQEE